MPLHTTATTHPIAIADCSVLTPSKVRSSSFQVQIPVPELLYMHSSWKMAKSVRACDLLEGEGGEDEEGYIDMDISSASADKDATPTFLLVGTMSSPPHAKEFEFRMGANLPGAEAATCPADELFHEGKLLPLHHVLLEKTPKLSSGALEEKFSTGPATAASTAAATPFGSCNISPASSCFVSGELNAEVYFSECSSRQNRPGHKKSWSKKLKSIKQSSVALRLKASRDYLKSLFAKSDRPDEPCTAKKAKECSDGYTNAVNLNPLSQIQMKRYLFDDSTGATSLMKVIEREKMMEEESVHRKSFSGAINWNFTTKLSSCSSSVSSSSSSSTSSSSSSSSSNAFHQSQMLKRSNSANSEEECSIQGAIAYCKKSQQLNCGRKSVSDVGFYSLSLQQISARGMDKQGQVLAGGHQIELASSAPVLSV